MKNYKDINELTKDLTILRNASTDKRDKVRVLTLTDTGMIDDVAEFYYEAPEGHYSNFLKSGKLSAHIKKHLVPMIESGLQIKLENITQTYY